ncbi:hypothetical protein GCM10010170_052560 [Dactylosporangium salmoneum]|uniref:Uncharacterized protein n=1 Tax=Dactylosporangium salmoneum TaxID=53361 RepID=A0ABN3GSP0_9ACTN
MVECDDGARAGGLLGAAGVSHGRQGMARRSTTDDAVAMRVVRCLVAASVLSAAVVLAAPGVALASGGADG